MADTERFGPRVRLPMRSLQVTVAVAIALITVIVLVVAWRITLNHTRSQVNQTASNHARVLAYTVGKQLERIGPQADAETLQAVLGIQGDGQFQGAVLLDTNEVVVASMTRRGDDLEAGVLKETPLGRLPVLRAITAASLNRALASYGKEVATGDGFVASVYRVAPAGDPNQWRPSEFSTLILWFDTRSALAAAEEEAVRGLRLVSVLLVFLATGLWWGIKCFLLDRIHALNNAARRIAKGDFSTETRLPGRDEIARLSQSLNQVAAWVENSTAALRESERSYRELVETSADLIWSADAEGRWTFVNRTAAAQIYGCKVEEMLGRRIASFATEETEADNVATFEQIDKGQDHIQFETVHRGRDGMDVHLSFSGLVHRAPDGSVESLTGIARDTTRRRQVEEQVREQASLIDLASDAIFVRDLEDRVLFWNRGCERLFGWTKGEALGARSTALAFRDLEAVGEAQSGVLADGEWTGELRPVSKNGREIIVSSRWTLVRDAQGRPKSILCINTDITEKKQLEAQFLRVQRLEGIGTLASGIAHDLNNVFSPITISLALLKDKIKEPSAGKMLAVLGTSTKRGADIVKQLLTFARGTEGKMGLLQPAHLVKELVNIIKGTFPKAIRLEFNVPKTLWPVVGDATCLHQVLLNLCINARDAMPEGGTLILRADNLEVDDHFARLQPEAKPGPHVVIEVTDTGCGIPPENLQRIFDPFFTTKELGKGTGLGLSTALGIVKSHGGFITVKSARAVGTTFKVHLPAQPSQDGLVAERPSAPLPRGQGETVLVVEDEETVRHATVVTLEHNGYRAITASDGQEGGAIYRERHAEIDLILTDLMMPRQDGARLIRAVREIDLAVPILVSTGLDVDTASEQVGQYGIAAILEKPYTGEEMIRAIHSALIEYKGAANGHAQRE